jgi:hypothetical protein
MLLLQVATSAPAVSLFAGQVDLRLIAAARAAAVIPSMLLLLSMSNILLAAAEFGTWQMHWSTAHDK